LIPIQLQELEEMESRNSQLEKQLEQLEESLRLQAVPQTGSDHRMFGGDIPGIFGVEYGPRFG
jgi:Tfp pilus assembly protein FimV